MTDLLQLSAISKSYGGTQVLFDVSASIGEREIVSIVGENGAGKSTLAKIIAGIVTPDTGTIRLRGETISFSSPGEAINAGIGIVHQELCLVENLTVGQNIALGREPTRYGFVRNQSVNERARAALSRLHCDLDPTRVVATLSSAQKQLVEIARALSYDASLLVFDEPTSSLSDHEGDLLLECITRLRASGVAIAYVSHRLTEVMRISDRVIALRDGKNTGELRSPHIEHSRLISLIVGRETSDLYGYTPRHIGAPALVARELRPTSWHAPCSFTVHAGEIVGIAGLIGSGRTELLECLYGIHPPVSGSVAIAGSRRTVHSAKDARKAGIALVPESRKEQGIVPGFSISDNLTLATPAHPGSITRSPEAELTRAREQISALGIRCAGPDQAIEHLSGGNQQKAVIAKCLISNPSILLLDEPARGVDVGARREIYSLLFSLAERGMAILFVSSELEEVVGIADRILVMSEGALTGALSRDEFSEHAVMALASPHSEEAA